MSISLKTSIKKVLTSSKEIALIVPFSKPKHAWLNTQTFLVSFHSILHSFTHAPLFLQIP